MLVAETHQIHFVEEKGLEVNSVVGFFQDSISAFIHCINTNPTGSHISYPHHKHFPYVREQQAIPEVEPTASWALWVDHLSPNLVGPMNP